jgi:hypothetical protein
MTLETFKSMLETHDWFYSYSDDHRYYKRGRDQRALINKALDELTEQGLEREAKDLFNEVSPDDFYIQ